MQMMHEKGATAGRPSGLMVRSEGLEPPRCYSLPPQGSASTNSATSAWETGIGMCAGPGSTARDVTNQRWGDKACRTDASELGYRNRINGYPAAAAAFA